MLYRIILSSLRAHAGCVLAEDHNSAQLFKQADRGSSGIDW
jgi:hypothetical protein